MSLPKRVSEEAEPFCRRPMFVKGPRKQLCVLSATGSSSGGWKTGREPTTMTTGSFCLMLRVARVIHSLFGLG